MNENGLSSVTLIGDINFHLEVGEGHIDGVVEPVWLIVLVCEHCRQHDVIDWSYSMSPAIHKARMLLDAGRDDHVRHVGCYFLGLTHGKSSVYLDLN